MEIAQLLIAIVRNNQYWLNLDNESNMITKFFDTGLTCYGNLYTYIDNVLVSLLITLFYVFFCSFWVPYYESKVPAGSVPTNLRLLDKIDFSKITLRSLKAEDMWGAISAARFFVSCYRHSFGGSKFNSFSRWWLDIWSCPDEGIGVWRVRDQDGFLLSFSGM